MSGAALPDDFAERLAGVRAEIRELGRPDARLIAVTKAFPAALVADAVHAGVTDIGENYAQEVIEKGDAFGSASVHFIGRIQRNTRHLIRDGPARTHCGLGLDVPTEVGDVAP